MRIFRLWINIQNILTRRVMLQSEDTSDMSPLCQHLSTVAEVMQQHLKQIRRRVTSSPDTVSLPIPELATNLLKTSISASKLTKALRDIAKTAFSEIAMMTGWYFEKNVNYFQMSSAILPKSTFTRCLIVIKGCRNGRIVIRSLGENVHCYVYNSQSETIHRI